MAGLHTHIAQAGCRGGCSPNWIQDHFSDINVAVTAVTAVNAPFLCFHWTAVKTSPGTLLCHDSAGRGSVNGNKLFVGVSGSGLAAVSNIGAVWQYK